MMRRRDFIQNLTAVGALAALPSFARAQKKKRPNLLFVFSDQHSYDLLGCNGHAQVKTPNLDAFSRQALNIDSCFSVSPLCTPMRGSLLSGLYPLHNGAYDNCIRMLEGNGTYFAEVLKKSGYKTAYVGKWHLYGGYFHQPVPAGPYRYGFDDVFLSNNADLNYWPENAFYFDQYTGEKIKFNEWEPDGQTRQAMEFLDKVDADEPWSLFVSWHPPHCHKTRLPQDYYSYSAPQKYLDRYDYDTVQVREGTTPTEGNRRMMHGYMSLISSVDDCFGQLMAKLKERGLDENTIVVYTSDHGDMLKMEQNVLFQKYRPQSTSTQVPFMIRVPGMTREDTRSALPFGTLDIMPTVLSLMDVQPPATCHGRDLSHALIAGDQQAQAAVPIMMQSLDHWRGVATKDWIYAYSPYQSPAAGPTSYNVLFDRHSDPLSLRNLIKEPECQETKAEMHRLTKEWMDRFEDPFMPYVALRDATVDPSELGKEGFIAPFNKSARGILRERPIDVCKRWAASRKT